MNEAQIYIVGQIGNFGDEKGVQLEDVISQVNAHKEADKYIVKIKTPGGDYDLGFDIYNYLKSLGKPVDTVAIGEVASIGSVIFMAGDNRVMMPGSSIMIHNPWTNPQGAYEANDLENLASWMRDAENNLLSFYSKNTNNTKEAIKPLMRVETVLNPDRSKDLGFATEVMVELNQAFAYRNIKNDEMSKAENKSILNQIKDLLNGQKPEIKNLIVNVADGQLDFFEMSDDEQAIMIGAKATFNGEPAQGEYVEEGGRTFVFESGVLNEIRTEEPAADEEAEAMDLEALKSELVTDVTNSVLEALNQTMNSLEVKQEEIVAKMEERNSLFAGLKDLVGEEVKEEKKNQVRKKEEKADDVEVSVFSKGFEKYNKN